MIDFHTSEHVQPEPGYLFAPTADVIHARLSAHLEPWYREFLMAQIMKIATRQGERLTTGAPVEATILQFPRVVND